MTPAIKICGICNLADAQLAIDHGAEYLGLIFVQSSPRYVEPGLARSIVESIDRKAKIVGVFQNAADNEIDHIIDFVGLDYLQLHGNESPVFCATLSRPIIKSFQIAAPNQILDEQPCLTLPLNNTNDNQLDFDRCLNMLDQYRPYCSYFLFDKPKHAPNTNWLDFAITQLGLIEDQLGDYFLAGGLNADNVKTALQKLKPAVVDIASGIEKTAREKNRKLMTDFFTALEFQY